MKVFDKEFFKKHSGGISAEEIDFWVRVCNEKVNTELDSRYKFLKEQLNKECAFNCELEGRHPSCKPHFFIYHIGRLIEAPDKLSGCQHKKYVTSSANINNFCPICGDKIEN